MSAAIEAGSGIPLPMSAKASPRLRPSPFDSRTPIVCSRLPSYQHSIIWVMADTIIDANLFKDAFVKAQAENESAFSQSEEAATEAPAAE